MKALSIRQPWADLIVRGIKDVENRSWTTKYRGPLLIHASAKEDIFFAFTKFFGLQHQFAQGGIVGTVDLVDVVNDSQSPWAGRSAGTYHWVFANARRVDFREVTGKLQLFEVDWPPATPAAPLEPLHTEEREAPPDAPFVRGGDGVAVRSAIQGLPVEVLAEITRSYDPSLPAPTSVDDFVSRFGRRLNHVLGQLTLEHINARLGAFGAPALDDWNDAAATLYRFLPAGFADFDDEGRDEGELVTETGLTMEKGYFYYYRNGAILRLPLRQKKRARNGEGERVLEVPVTEDPGYDYFMAEDTSIRRLRRQAESDAADDASSATE